MPRREAAVSAPAAAGCHPRPAPGGPCAPDALPGRRGRPGGRPAAGGQVDPAASHGRGARDLRIPLTLPDAPVLAARRHDRSGRDHDRPGPVRPAVPARSDRPASAEHRPDVTPSARRAPPESRERFSTRRHGQRGAARRRWARASVRSRGLGACRARPPGVACLCGSRAGWDDPVGEDRWPDADGPCHPRTRPGHQRQADDADRSAVDSRPRGHPGPANSRHVASGPGRRAQRRRSDRPGPAGDGPRRAMSNSAPGCCLGVAARAARSDHGRDAGRRGPRRCHAARPRRRCVRPGAPARRPRLSPRARRSPPRHGTGSARAGRPRAWHRNAETRSSSPRPLRRRAPGAADHRAADPRVCRHQRHPDRRGTGQARRWSHRTSCHGTTPNRGRQHLGPTRTRRLATDRVRSAVTGRSAAAGLRPLARIGRRRSLCLPSP